VIRGFFLALLFSAAAWAQLPVPPLTARVIDQTATLTSEQRAELERKLRELELRKGSQIAVLIVPSTAPETVEQYALRVAEEWKLGRKGIDDGALLLIAKNDRAVRIEVGYGLEGTLTDAVSRLIIENSIVPRFRANDFPGGIARGVDDIISVLTGDAEEWKQRAAQRPDTVSTSPSTQSDSVWPVVIVVLIVVGVIILCFLWAGAFCEAVFQILSVISSVSGGRGSGSSGGFSGGGGGGGGGGAW